MKKICILVAIISLFILQSSVVMAYDQANNIDLDPGANNTGTYNNLSNDTYSCGEGMINGISITVIDTVHIVYLILQVAVPIILVIMGMITLLKSVTSSKEDEIKKAQMNFVKKLIMGALVFFVFVIVKLVISVASDSGTNTKIINCANCFINGTDSGDCNKNYNKGIFEKAKEFIGGYIGIMDMMN